MSLNPLSFYNMPGYFPAAHPVAGRTEPPVPPPAFSVNRVMAEQHKEQGNKYRKLQLHYEAIREYAEAIRLDPGYTDAYYNLGRTYVVVGDPANAARTLEQLLAINPADHEARILLAEQRTRLGQPDQARRHYELILDQVPMFDPARRNLRLLDVKRKAQTSPQAAYFLLQGSGQQALNQAKVLAKNYCMLRNDPAMLPVMDAVRYEFAPTEQVNQVANLAEYDHMRRTIRFAPEMAFAHPNVLAAYMVHELVHARDNDAITSVMEEQDGYRELARFWLVNRGQVIEPNLDLAAALYGESPDRLDQKVRELYTMRDPLMSEKSPGHGMPYMQMIGIQAQADYLEKVSKYTQFIYDRIKSLLPLYPLV